MDIYLVIALALTGLLVLGGALLFVVLFRQRRACRLRLLESAQTSAASKSA
jgi:hypothetical protein